MAEELRLWGMKALVIGAGGGIGEAIARTLAKEGAEVLAIDSANSGVDADFKSVQGITGEIIDVQSADAAAQVADAARAQFGRMDIVICDVNPRVSQPLNDADSAEVESVLERKQQLVAGVCNGLLPLMKNSPAGRIAILGFLRSMFGRNGSASFARSTEALARLTAELAADAGQHGINVNYIQPGAIMTPDSRRTFKKDKSLRDYCIARSAAKRLGEPIDIAKVALFLATDDSVFVSGTGIVVDGGRSAPWESAR